MGSHLFRRLSVCTCTLSLLAHHKLLRGFRLHWRVSALSQTPGHCMNFHPRLSILSLFFSSSFFCRSFDLARFLRRCLTLLPFAIGARSGRGLSLLANCPRRRKKCAISEGGGRIVLYKRLREYLSHGVPRLIEIKVVEKAIYTRC